jgi:FAD/FMN-containing dehydrogenase
MKHNYRGKAESPLPPGVYESRKSALEESFRRGGGKLRVGKSTSSNLFRYNLRDSRRGRAIALDDFNHVLSLDEQAQTVEVEGLITYEKLVAFTLSRGYLPTVSPELKHITVGGAIVGIGIESTCFRHGFVHDGLLEADVFLPDGRIVTCSADNEYSDLFAGLPNSYGTLGYILRAKLRLLPAKDYVQVDNRRFDSLQQYFEAMEQAAGEAENDFVEGIFYSADEFYLTTGRLRDEAPRTMDIYRDHIYYKLLRADTSFYLDTYDYIFRYDPDWFWNIPEGGLYDLLRKHGPLAIRSSGFYNRYVDFTDRLKQRIGLSDGRDRREPLIQDWQLPWDRAPEFVRYALDNVDLQGQPWVGAPIRAISKPTNYPIRTDSLYFNMGCYCGTERPRADIDFYYTRILDDKCFELGGIKMLYSSTFLQREEFDRLYNGSAYAELKKRYDPEANAPTLFEKAVMNR